MEVTPPGPTGPTVNQSSARPEQTSALSSDFETFLKMLTAQMENQDPLNPLQSSDFAVQLATFSGVEQQVRTNDLLQGLASRLGGGAVADFADWISKEARADMPVLFAGDPITVATSPPAGADEAALVVRDSSGRAVDRVPIPVEGGDVIWDGVSATGQPFLSGLYDFSVEARADGEVISESGGEVYATITEARVTAAGQVELVMAGGATVAPEDVTALRLTAP